MKHKNTVELIGTYGDDKTIALSAWTSTSRELSPEKEERIPQLIKRLWDDGHHSVFEKGIVHFLVDTDIASHIHLLKHRISSANAESARYKELKEDKFYLPSDDGWNNKMETTSMTWVQRLESFTKESNELYHQCLKELTPILGRKRAKESARYFKTYNSQIACDIMFNMRSFANFQKLRNSEDAQNEIRDIAQQMLSLVKETGKFKDTLNAWNI